MIDVKFHRKLPLQNLGHCVIMCTSSSTFILSYQNKYVKSEQTGKYFQNWTILQLFFFQVFWCGTERVTPCTKTEQEDIHEHLMTDSSSTEMVNLTVTSFLSKYPFIPVHFLICIQTSYLDDFFDLVQARGCA